MAKQKYDGVVEAVHYKPDGQVDWVRAFESRGPIFTDWVLIGREALIERLTSGKKFVIGKRISQMANTFEVSKPVRLVNVNGEKVLVTGDTQADEDCLEGVPVI